MSFTAPAREKNDPNVLCSVGEDNVLQIWKEKSDYYMVDIEEEVALRIHMTAILRARENHFYQHEMGMLDINEWKTMRKALGTLFIDNQLNLDIWNKSKSTFNPDFVKIVDEEIQMRKDTFKK